MDMAKTRLWKRFTAGLMVLVMTLVFSGVRGNAAEKQDVTYIKTFKLYSGKGATQEDAKAWCEGQGEDWHVIPGNLNDGADALLNRKVGAFLCYQTTTDSKEAVTDIAVMNEKGNYSSAAYEQILEQQKEFYKDLVSDTKQMLEEYRTNVAKELKTAIQVRNYLNGYKEDDSGELLGDLLLKVDDDKLSDILMQANGQVVLMVQEQLALACDTGKSTWLDRMSALGKTGDAYARLMKAAKNSPAALKKAYHEKAVSLSESWEDVRQHIEHIKNYINKNGLKDKNDEEKAEWFAANKDDAEFIACKQESQMMAFLAGFPYEGGTLLDFFEQKVEAVSGNNIERLYPLAASLSKGQQAGLNESVSLFTLIMDASAACIMNDYKTGASADIEKAVKGEDESNQEKVKDKVEETMTEWKNIEPISIYEGVDREIYKDGGVAVTSTAESYSNSSEKKWVDGFVESGTYSRIAIGMGIGTGVTCALSVVGAVGARITYNAMIKKGYQDILFLANSGVVNDFDIMYRDAVRLVENYSLDKIKTANSRYEFYQLNTEFKRNIEDVRQYLVEKGAEKIGGEVKYKVFKTIEMGFTVITVFLAVADIIVNAVTLYQYYNREHMPIPHHMVDLSIDDKGNITYVTYKNVLTQDEKVAADLNGGNGKQWLVIYQTKSADAGEPILAPATDEDKAFLVQTGSTEAPDGYMPLHMFGTKDTPQNLTFADGENGWSYNDKNGGTYLFFKKDANASNFESGASVNEKQTVTDEKDKATPEVTDSPEVASGSAIGTEDTSTASPFGRNMLFGSILLVVGFALGFGICIVTKKRKSREE